MPVFRVIKPVIDWWKLNPLLKASVQQENKVLSMHFIAEVEMQCALWWSLGNSSPPQPANICEFGIELSLFSLRSTTTLWLPSTFVQSEETRHRCTLSAGRKISEKYTCTKFLNHCKAFWKVRKGNNTLFLWQITSWSPPQWFIKFCYSEQGWVITLVFALAQCWLKMSLIL